jgi:hypothetical protein
MKGCSAAKAGRIVRRVKPVKIVAQEYRVYDENSVTVGTFKIIAALCRGVKVTTLKRRLERGVRDLVTLKAKPTKPGSRRRTR